jgi:feruloyl esterase
MVAAQRHPEDFDAIIAGAPVLNEIGDATLHLLWSARTNLGPDRRPILDAAKLPALRAAVMSACDAADGVRDDVIEDPRTCRFDPAAMQCAPGRDDTRCLTAAEVGVVRRLYAGAHDAAGRRLFPGGLARGSEYEWAPALIGAKGRAGLIIEQDTLVLSMLRYMVFEPDAGPTYGIHDFDFERDVPRIALTEPLYNAQNPDLRAFRDRGGRLLLYHGWDDLEIPPALTLDYYDSATRALGGPEATRAFFRLFMLPGVAHCRRGPGADAIDWLTVLEQWELEGRAPDAVEAFRLVKPQTYDGLPPVRFPLLPGAASATRAIPVFRVEPTLP